MSEGKGDVQEVLSEALRPPQSFAFNIFNFLCNVDNLGAKSLMTIMILWILSNCMTIKAGAGKTELGISQLDT